MCLSEGHSAKQCTRGFTCAKSGYGKAHHHLIHSDEVDVKGSGIQANSRDENKGTAVEAVADPRSVPGSIATNIGPDTPPRVSNNTTVPPGYPVTVGVVRAGRPRVCFKVVPVKISGHSGTKVTYAFLDSGSDASFCLESLVRELGLKEMKPPSFTMATVNCEEKRPDHEVQLNIKSLEGDTEFKLDHVSTTESPTVTPR